MLHIAPLSKKKKKKVLQKIIKECFWDYRFSIEDIERILDERDERELQKLFEKIIFNAQDKVLSLALFQKEDLKKLFASFQITRNDWYIQKHVGALRAIFFEEAIVIKGLEWRRV